nr:hypothetical protein Iba_scaffold14897CG0760 [Ipomoea batatas]
MDSMHSLRDREYQTPMRSITSMSSLSYTNTIDESTSQAMDLITISDIFDTENEDDMNTGLQLSDGDDDFLEVHAAIEGGESMLYKYH